MRTVYQFLRITVFCLGVLLVALGVSLSTKAALGTSPISAIPYSLSLCIKSLSFGTWVIIFNLSLICLEWLLLRGNIKLPNLLMQIALTFLFGYCIDFFMDMLADFNPDIYMGQILTVFAGCFIIALGACLDILSNISVLPGDGFVLALASVTKKEYGRMRMLSDILMSLTGIAICLTVLGNIAGVREGTAIAAVATGYFVLILMKVANARKVARRAR